VSTNVSINRSAVLGFYVSTDGQVETNGRIFCNGTSERINGIAYVLEKVKFHITLSHSVDDLQIYDGTEFVKEVNKMNTDKTSDKIRRRYNHSIAAAQKRQHTQ
jgi:hypothetical protein